MRKGRLIWVMGGTSTIAHAYARRRAQDGARLILVGRNETELRANAADLLARGAKSASITCCDLVRPDDFDSKVTDLSASQGPPDEVLIAYGTMGKQSPLVDCASVRAVIDTNFTSVACWTLAIITNWMRASALTLVVIGSVAGDRGRARNFLYGSAKGGLDRFLEGLQQAYAGTQLRIIRVKPGFVDTPMTDGMDKSGPLWSTPERVAADIERAVDRGRAVVYTPWYWRPIMMIIRHLPRLLFNRLKF